MALIKQVSGAAWPTSGTATDATTGLQAIVGTSLVHSVSTDMPPGSKSASIFSGAVGTPIDLYLQDPGVIFSTSNVYTYSTWVRHRLPGAEPAAGIERRILDANGNGIQAIFRLYTAAGGLTAFLSPVSGTGGVQTRLEMLSSNVMIIPYNIWAKYTVEIDTTAANGGVRFYINDNLIDEFVGVTSMSGNGSLTECGTLTFGFAGVIIDMAGPIESFSGPSDPIIPLQRAIAATDNTVREYPIRFANRNRGACWNSYVEDSMLTLTEYATGGINPQRKRAVLSGAGTAEFTLAENIGAPQYNEAGWLSVVFPMVYAPDGTSINLSIRNAANTANIVNLEVEDFFTLGATTIGEARTFGHRYAVLIHLHQSGQLHATTVNLTAAGGTQRVYSGWSPSGWTPQTLGKIIITIEVDSAAELDGAIVSRWFDFIGIDSLACTPATTVTPDLNFVNNVSALTQGKFSDHESVDRSTLLDPQRSVAPFVVGRSGSTSATFTSDVIRGMQWSRGIRLVLIDGGSINDTPALNDANRKASGLAWRAQLLNTVSQMVSSTNRVLLTTMIRREQGTYTAVQLREADRLSAYVREVFQTCQRSIGGRPLLQLADVSLYVDSHLSLFTAGDNTHFNAAGNITVGGLVKSLATTAPDSPTLEVQAFASSILTSPTNKIATDLNGAIVSPVIVLPASVTIPDRNRGNLIQAFTSEEVLTSPVVKDLTGDPVSLLGLPIWFGAWDRRRNLLLNLTPIGNSTGFTVTLPKMTAQVVRANWVLRHDDASGEVIANGPFEVIYAAGQP